MTTVTLADGREVDSASPEWRDECLRVHEHILNLKVIRSRGARADYIADVAHSEGVGLADHVSRRFVEVFAEMRAGVRKAAEAHPA